MLFGRFSFLLVFLLVSLNAESFEYFKRSKINPANSFKNKNDKDFSNNLSKQFKSYKYVIKDPFFTYLKPNAIEKSLVTKSKDYGPRINIKIPDDSNQSKAIKMENDFKKNISFNFFKMKLSFDIPLYLKSAKYYPQNQKGINNFFRVASSSDYNGLVKDIKTLCKDLNLNDWAVYLLVHKISNNTFRNNDDASLLAWFLFSKMGYDVKIAISAKHIVLLYNFKNNLYEVPSFKIAKKNYYLLSAEYRTNIPRIYTYPYDYSKTLKAFDLSLSSLPRFKNDKKTKLLKFDQYGKEYQFNISYNQNIIDFMDSYPQVDYQTFFSATLEDQTYKDLANGFKKILDGKKATSAINFVLNFTQNTFIYESDKKQFGKEKLMFAQQVLIYDKSDCEDRVTLFANLIKKLFAYTVIGVKYKDHMVAALYIPIEGDSVKINTKRYVIADPSYANATIGQSMFKYKSVKPEKFISLVKSY